MAARRYELTDEQWEQIKDLIPRAKTGRPPKDNRKFDSLDDAIERPIQL